jgi:hypothetical protein
MWGRPNLPHSNQSRPVGCRDRENQPPAVLEILVVLQVEIRSGLTRLAETGLAVVEWNGYPLLASRCTLKRDLLS